MRLNKRGAELSINVIIIAILVIIVLVIVAAFFTGGSSKLFKNIKEIFGGATAGTDRSFAESNCNLYCSQAAELQNPSKSPYCTKYFEIDENSDGEAEFIMEGTTKIYKKYYCGANSRGENNLGVSCIIKGEPVVC
jgi:hypothetical protein